MNNEQYIAIQNSLSNAMKRFPNCKIANCDCDSKHGERKGDCHCLCHIEEIKKQIESQRGCLGNDTMLV